MTVNLSQSQSKSLINGRDISGELHALLDAFMDVFDSVNGAYEAHKIRLAGIRERLDQERIHLAVLGQFKRGKSSFLNALLGEAVLPVSVIPLTSVPTYIRHGAERSVRVCFTGKKEDDVFSSKSPDELRAFLSRYVSEEENPENRMNVEGVELLFDSPLLERGVVLIDTPGIGSTHLHNTEATLNFLPQCDAALFLVSADPPITEAEIVFLRQVRSKVGRIIFILNKIDYLSETERGEVAGFITKVLKNKAEIDGEPEIFPFSAKFALDSLKNSDEAMRAESGIGRLLEFLDGFITREKRSVLCAALARKAADIFADMDMQVRLALRAFRLPADELGEKMALFNGKIREAEIQKTVSGDMLEGERKRLILLLEEQSEVLRKKSRRHLETVLNEFFSRDTEVKENDVRDAFSAAIPVFFERELGDMSSFFDGRVAEIIGFHRRRADEIIDTVRKSASDIFEIPYHTRESTEGLELHREPYWVLHQWKSALLPVPEEIIDRLLPRRFRERRIRKRLEEQIHGLVVSNVENLRWSTLQNLDLTFRKFMTDLEERFSEIAGITREAVGAAMEKRKHYSEDTADEVKRLENTAAKLDDLKAGLKLIL